MAGMPRRDMADEASSLFSSTPSDRAPLREERAPGGAGDAARRVAAACACYSRGGACSDVGNPF